MWPVLHNQLPDRHAGGESGGGSVVSMLWDAYVKANESFAHVLIKVIRPMDLIWVHSYPLLLVPSALATLKVSWMHMFIKTDVQLTRAPQMYPHFVTQRLTHSQKYSDDRQAANVADPPCACEECWIDASAWCRFRRRALCPSSSTRHSHRQRFGGYCHIGRSFCEACWHLTWSASTSLSTRATS